MEIDDHIGCAMSGLIADARTLVEHARVETQVLGCSYLILVCFLKLAFREILVVIPKYVVERGSFTDFLSSFVQNHRFSYGEPMTIESTTQALCDLALRFGEGDEEESMVITTYLVNILGLFSFLCLYCSLEYSS